MVYGSAFAGFFVMIDPLGASPIFVSITKDCSFEAQIILAFKAVLVATMLLTCFIMLGASAFEYLGILPAVFKLAGGLLLFSFSGSLLASNSEKANKDIEEQEEPVVAVAELRPSPSTEGLLKTLGSCFSNPHNSPALAPHPRAPTPPSPVLTPHQAIAAAAQRLQQAQVQGQLGQLDSSPGAGIRAAPLDLTDLSLGLSHGTNETGDFNAVQPLGPSPRPPPPPATATTTSSKPISRTSSPLSRYAKVCIWITAFPTVVRSKGVREEVQEHMGSISKNTSNSDHNLISRHISDRDFVCSVFPMATPLMAGPGAIAFAVLITEIAQEEASGSTWVATLEVLSGTSQEIHRSF